jgi:hypothetical protein
LWALGFGAAMMVIMFGEFQKLIAMFGEKIGHRLAKVA